jgi:hypothetical protein
MGAGDRVGALFTPFRLRNLTLPNRIVMPASSTGSKLFHRRCWRIYCGLTGARRPEWGSVQRRRNSTNTWGGMNKFRTRHWLLAAALVASAGHAADAPKPQRNVYFGDLHLHTSFSFDAYVLMGTRNTPEVAYRYARGETVESLGRQLRRAWPLDFLAVTDHSENIGVFNTLEDAESPLSKSELGQKSRGAGRAAFIDILRMQASGQGPPGVDTRSISRSAWQTEITMANANYQPGKFTTFIAYEWSSMGGANNNLHRNVIFRGDHAPFPFSSLDSKRPEDLWSYLEANRRQGIEALAIPHNGDASGGLMYDWNDSDGKPIDQAYAERRVLNEPLSEISQNKGQSETVPELSPGDEFANFEVFRNLLGASGVSRADGSYMRQAWGRGLVIEARLGINPFRFGTVGGTDFHGGLSASGEDAYDGMFGIDQSLVSDAKLRLTRDPALLQQNGYSPLDNGSGNITGVWAEANTRESIYDALRRKETYATSGTRIQLRFFGGWDYARDAARLPAWVSAAYAKGVPMGGDLPARPAGQRAPRFIVWALKDPAAANLDRVQIVKLWLDRGQYRERIFDVALSNGRKVEPASGHAPPVGNTVDLKTGAYTNSIGATTLSAVWSDPGFQATVPAVYYVRALEIPTPRWSTLLAVKTGVPVPADAPATVQERAWSSPIWYRPAR